MGKEEETVYRYISFEQLVDLQQKQALTFVLPEIWEDPTEKIIFDRIIELLDDQYMAIQLNIYKSQTFCQCWTTLAESDAMWRIYAFGNKSIRISAYRSDLLNLEKSLVLKDVTYTDEDIEKPQALERDDPEYGAKIGQIVLDSLTRKRTVFSHEKEVRLICPSPIGDGAMEIIDYYIAFFTSIGDTEMIKRLCQEKHTIDPYDESQVQHLLNIGDGRRITKDISFSKCPYLIKGVMVHPLAPDWYVDTVKIFCNNHSIPFEGKSKLYS